MRANELRDDVFITSELSLRVTHVVDHLKEKRALQDLANRMVDTPDEVLPRFVELAMAMAGGVSSGLSLLEPSPSPGVFRWHHVCGKLSRFDGATTPRNYSPCGVTLDENGPVLTRHAERLYTWISDAGIEVPEVLLVPLYIGQKPLGTLWIVSDDAGHFNANHARMATELATFVGIALRVKLSEESLRSALEAQETLAHEMSHRVKNLFALVNTMIRFGAKAAKDKDDFSQSLIGRIHALAISHQLVMTKELSSEASDLARIISSVIEPHQTAAGLRFGLEGSVLAVKPEAISGLALVINELATNAIKYGALASDEGKVAISWKSENDHVLLRWEERGGAAIESPPERTGFGSRLLDTTITRQFGGTFSHDWQSEGVVVSIVLPRTAIQG